MDYEKKYNEALDAIKKLQEANPSDEGIQNWVNDNFPKLRESEDERIRKALIDLIKSKEEDGYMVINNFSTGSILAWLEKQGKPKWSEADKTIMEDIIGYCQSERDITSDEEYIMDLDKYLRLLERVRKAMEEQQ